MLGGLTFGAGNLFFPISYIFGDILTEVYGYGTSRRVVWYSFAANIVAALLTILGYSINDTVVVFDRLRENLVKYKTMPLKEVMNLSVNETLSRTLMTSITTLIAVGSMIGQYSTARW